MKTNWNNTFASNVDEIFLFGDSERFGVEGDGGVADKRRFSGVADVEDRFVNALFAVEVEYCKGNYAKARAEVDDLMQSRVPAIRLAAQTYRMVISVATANVDAAYEDFCQLRTMCERGIAIQGGEAPFGAYVLSATIIEATLLASVFDLPDPSLEMESFPNGMRVYFGYLLAMRAMREGEFSEALGMSRAFQSLVGTSFPEPRTFLLLISAVANIMSGNVEAAEADYDKASDLREQYGVITPHAEISPFLLGLPRRRSIKHPDDDIHKIDAMAKKFRAGWFGLRQRCGLPCNGMTMTPLETCVAGLASIGWSNDDIANWLYISDNTVKHHLTASYRKLGVKGRKQLQSELTEQFLHNSVRA